MKKNCLVLLALPVACIISCTKEKQLPTSPGIASSTAHQRTVSEFNPIDYNKTWALQGNSIYNVSTGQTGEPALNSIYNPKTIPNLSVVTGLAKRYNVQGNYFTVLTGLTSGGSNSYSFYSIYMDPSGNLSTPTYVGRLFSGGQYFSGEDIEYNPVNNKLYGVINNNGTWQIWQFNDLANDLNAGDYTIIRQNLGDMGGTAPYSLCFDVDGNLHVLSGGNTGKMAVYTSAGVQIGSTYTHYSNLGGQNPHGASMCMSRTKILYHITRSSASPSTITSYGFQSNDGNVSSYVSTAGSSSTIDMTSTPDICGGCQ